MSLQISRTRGAALVLGLVLISGCKNDPISPYTEDIRIDGGSQSNDPDSQGAQLCTTTDGKMYALWVDNRDHRNEDGHNDIWMNRSLELGAEGTWLPAPIRVNQGEGRVWNPDLYCNETGVYVVWEDDRDGDLGNHQIYFNASTDGGESFMPADILLETADPEGDSSSIDPQITGAGAHLAVAWSDTLYGAPDILSTNSSDSGATWETPQRLDSDDPGDAYSARPQIEMSLSGQDVWVTWEDSRDGQADIYFAYSASGGTNFERDKRLDEGDEDGATDSFAPHICSDGGANVYVVWHDSRGGEGYDIYMNYSPTKGEDWQAVAFRMDSDAPGLGNSLFPICAVSGSEAHIIWYDKRAADANFDIFYRLAKAGIPDNPEIRLDAGTPEGFYGSVEPTLAFRDGTLAVGWRDSRGEAVSGANEGFEDLYYNYRTSDAPFASDEDYRIDSWVDGSSHKSDLNLSLLGGSLYAVWTDDRNGTSDVFFTTLAIGEESDPPTLEDLEQAQ